MAGEALAWIIGSYAILFGARLVALSLRLRKLSKSLEQGLQAGASA